MELLVTISIIGLIVGLLLPAVQAAREAARRMSCTNNIRQLGIALHNYESAYRQIPPSRINISNPRFQQSWVSMILPYIEQGNIHNSYSHGTNWFDIINDPLTTVTIPTMICPSAPSSRELPTQALYNNITFNTRTDSPIWGYTDYSSINAVRNSVFVLAGLPSLGTRETLGAMGRGPNGVKFAEITDGLSNTMIIAEGAGRPTMYVLGKPSINQSPGLAFGSRTTIDGWGWADINAGFSIDGANELGIQNSTNSAGVVTGTGLCMINCSNDSEIYSFHSGGSNSLFADSSCHFLSKDIDIKTLCALITRNYGDIPGEY